MRKASKGDARLRRGEDHPNAILDNETVEAIREDLVEYARLRELIAQYTYPAIGKRYGISAKRVGDIARLDAWAHLPWPDYERAQLKGD